MCVYAKYNIMCFVYICTDFPSFALVYTLLLKKQYVGLLRREIHGNKKI